MPNFLVTQIISEAKAASNQSWLHSCYNTFHIGHFNSCLRTPVHTLTVRVRRCSLRKACINTYGLINLQETLPAPAHHNPVQSCCASCHTNLISGYCSHCENKLFYLRSFPASAQREALVTWPQDAGHCQGNAQWGTSLRAQVWSSLEFIHPEDSWLTGERLSGPELSISSQIHEGCPG